MKTTITTAPMFSDDTPPRIRRKPIPPSPSAQEHERQRVGRRGEERVAQWLEDHGVNILARNWRGAAGEADIIAHDGTRLRIIEVKTRRGTGYGHPLEAITPEKYERLWRLGLEYRRKNCPARDLAVDAAAVLLQGGQYRVEYLADVRP